VLANDSERSEAGEEYNEDTIQFLKDRMEATVNQQYMTKKKPCARDKRLHSGKPEQIFRGELW